VLERKRRRTGDPAPLRIDADIQAAASLPEIAIPRQARRQRPEAAIQRAIFAHLRQRPAPCVFAFHPANGGYRTAVEAAIFKSLGVVAGTPDVIVIKDGATYALELKADNGKLSETQCNTIEAMRAAGAIVGVAVGIDEALAWLEERELLKGKTQ
jgi:hypothetical protein